MSGTAVRDAVVALRAAHDALAALPVESLTTAELLAALDELETLGCRLPVQCHRMLARLQTETTAKELGAKSWKEVLRIRWRLSAAEASRRMAEAAVLGPRRPRSSWVRSPLSTSRRSGRPSRRRHPGWM